MPRRRWAVRSVQVAAVGATLAVLLALVVHSPPVRRAALNRAVILLADRFDIALRADALSYNLFALRVSLTDLEVASTRTPQVPFLTADRLDISIPASALLGPFSLEHIGLTNARLDIRFEDDGRSNLPQTGESSGGEPQALPIERIVIDRLAVAIDDRANDISLELPALTVDVGQEDGNVRLTEQGRASIGQTALALSALGGGLAFDGRSIALTAFEIATPDARINADGDVALLVEEPGVDLTYTARGDLARLARLVPDPPPIAGIVEMDGTVTGPFSAPQARMRARSETLRWDAFELADVEAAVEADPGRVDVPQFAAGVSGGRVTGNGSLAIETGAVDLAVSWEGVDADRLLRSLGNDDVPIAARANGSATAQGAGSDPAAWTIDTRVQLQPTPRRRGQLAVGGDARLRTVAGAWSLDAAATAEQVPVHASLAGRLNATRLGASTLSGSLVTQDVDLPALIRSLREAGLITTADDPVSAGRARAAVQLAGTFETPRLQIMAEARDVAAAGMSDVAVDLTAAGTLQQLAVEAALRHQANVVNATGTVRPTAQAADLRVTGTLSDLRALQPDLPVQGVATLDLRVSGPFDALGAEGAVQVADAGYDRFTIGELLAKVDADARAVAVDVTAPELSVQARGNVALAADRRATVDVAIADADLARLVRDADLPVAVTGRLSLTATGEGSIDDWRRGTARVGVSTLDARVGDLPARLTAPASIVYADETIDVASLEADVGETHLSVAGRLPASDRAAAVPVAEALRALMVGDIAHVLAAVRAVGLEAPPDVAAEGPVALLARVTGTVERPAVAADLEVGGSEITVGDLPPVRVREFRASLDGGWIDRLTASAEWQDGRLTASGRIPLRLFGDQLPAAVLDALPATTGPASLDLRAESITPAVLEPFLDAGAAAQIAGTIDLSAQLTADEPRVEALRGEIRLDRLDVRLAGLPIAQRVPTRIELDSGVARVAAWEWTGQGATLNVQGEIGLATQQAALLAAGVVDLRALTPFLRTAGVSLSGTLAPRIAVTGSLLNPQVDGEAAITGGEIRLAEPRVIATGVNVFTVLTPTRARITSLSGVVNGGTLSGSGEARYGADGPLTARLTTFITGMGLQFPEGLRSELDADLTFSFAQQDDAASGRLEGNITVVRSAYREPLAVAMGLLTALRTERAVAAQADPDAFASRLALDVRLVTDSDVIVDNNVARLQLGGDLRIIGTAATPALSGRAVLREGGQLFLGRNTYTIREGSSIDFADPVTIVPELNVLASTRAGGHEIDLTLSGTPEELTFVTASPTLESETDRVAVLLTGRTYNEAQSAEGDIVREQMVAYLSGDALALATRVVGLDTIRLGGPDISTLRRDPAAVAAETDPTSRLTFGKLIGENIEITYSQSLRNGDAQTWIVDFRPIEQINLRMVSDDENLRAYEFRHDLSLGGPPRARSTTAARERPRQRITAVDLRGDDTFPEAVLRDVLTLEEGDTFDFVDWQRDRDRLESFLWRQGRLEARVTTEREEDDEGVAIQYEISVGPRTRLEVTGYDLARRDREAIEREWSQSIFDDFLRDEAERIVRAALAREGYLAPQVSSAVVEAEEKTLQIIVDPGVRSGRRRVSIGVAGDDVLAAELQDWISRQTIASNWVAPEDVRAVVIDELRARGYIAAQVQAEPPRPEGDAVVLPITIDPGPLFRIGEVMVAGASRIDVERIRAEAALEAGAPYVASELETARRRVDSMYSTEGFVAARVTVQPRVDQEAGRVDVTFTVDEGPQQVLSEVTVRGNRGIDTDVVTRELDVTVGEPMAADTWLRARSRLFDTGLFRRVDVSAEPLDVTADGSQRPTRLAVTVEEWPALRVRYGVQVSEERPEESLEGRDLTPGLSFDATRRTLFGRAFSVGVAGEYQRLERVGRVFFSTPTFFGLPVESLFSAERSRREYTAETFVTDLSSLAWEQRLRIGRTWQFGYSYRFDRDHTFDTEVSDDPFDPVFDVAVNVARLTTSAVFDTRDDPTESTRGWLLSTNLESAPTSLGSDVSFLRQLHQAYHFQALGPLVLASAARLGVVSPRGGQVLLPTELFRAGGARTLRGIDDDEAGPRDFFGPTGGRAVMLLNQEVRFPVYRWVRGVGFLDVGNVFAEPRDIRFGDMVTSFGAGLRIATPFALLRIDYGRAWTNVGESRPKRWTFGIGHTF